MLIQLKPSLRRRSAPQSGVGIGYVLLVAGVLLAAALTGLRTTRNELKAPQAPLQFDAITTLGHAVQLRQAAAALAQDARDKMPTAVWTGITATAIDPVTGKARLALTSAAGVLIGDYMVPAGWGVYATTYSGIFVAYAYSPVIASTAACSDLNYRLGNGKTTPSASYNIASAQNRSNVYHAVLFDNKDATGQPTDVVCKSFADGRRLMVTLFQTAY